MRSISLLGVALFATVFVGCGEPGPSSEPASPTGAVDSPDSAVDAGLNAFDHAPEPIRTRAADYPEDARRLGVQGLVRVYLSIDEEGRVVEASVSDESAPSLLRESALAAAREWQFRPATFEGAPVASRILVPFRFQLD